MSIFQVAGNNEPVNQETGKQPDVKDAPLKPVGTGAQEPGAPSNVTNINPDGTPMANNEKQEPTVVLDGPLSRIYTQALNLAYAKEDTGTMAMIIDAATREKEKQAEPEGVFVYASDADNLDTSELLKIQSWMSANQNMAKRQMVISLETHNNRVSKKSGLLEEMAKAYGVTVHYSRDSAMKAIHTKMKK